MEAAHEREPFLTKIKALFPCLPHPGPRSRTPNKSNYTCLYIGLTLLFVLFMVSAAGTIVMWFTDLYLDYIQKHLIIKEGTQVFESWSKPPLKPLICGYVFNYTNMDAFRRHKNSKIRIQEVGPYCYRETQEKVNISFSEDGDSVTYSDFRTHEFDPEHSKGNKDDILVVPNMALISLMAMSADVNFLGRIAISSFLRRWLNYSDSMITVRAHDYFFGYDDKLIEFLSNAARLLGQEIPFEKFGLLSQRAIVTDEKLTVKTGIKNLEEMGVVSEVNGETSLSVWPDAECNRIDGSDGAFFPRNGVNESAVLYLFHKDLCRRMPFVFDKEVEFQDGVMAMRFHAAPNVYDTNGTCYCPNNKCAPRGVFDLSLCSQGAPIMMSFPHFLYADPSVRASFEGLHPDPVKHDFYIDVQGILGFTLGTVSRLQLNVQVKKPRAMSMLKEFPQDLILPVVWLQVSSERLPPDLFNFIYHSSITVRSIQISLQWISLIVALISLILITLFVWKLKHEKPEEKQAVQEMLTLESKTVKR